MSERLIEIEYKAVQKGLKYAGDIKVADAAELFYSKQALLVDIRSKEELKTVGYIPDVINVPWKDGLTLTLNPRFTLQLGKHAKKNEPLFLICRSGRRSIEAAEAAHRAGFTKVYNVLSGVEGHIDGWSNSDLPWVEA